MKVKTLIMKIIRRIGFVNICPHCYTRNTKIISREESRFGFQIRRQCQRCFLSYDIVTWYEVDNE